MALRLADPNKDGQTDLMLFSVNLCGPLRLCGVEFAQKELTTEARRSH